MSPIYPGQIYPGQEVEAGDTYFTVAELRARFPEVTEAKYDDDTVTDAIVLAEEAFEDAADIAFITRTTTASVSTVYSNTVTLPRNRVTAITAVSGSTSGTLDLDGLLYPGGSIVENTAGWPTGELLTVTFEHGYTTPPERVKRAVMLLARTWLVRGPVDDRATQMSAPDGGVINLSTPGSFGAVFGIPEVDATLAEYRHKGVMI